MIKQVHTHPVVTTASSTTDRPNRAPRANTGVLLFALDVSGDWFSTDDMGMVT